MPTAVSTSLTTSDIRAYIYPEDSAYVAGSGDAEVLYSITLAPRQDDKEDRD